MDQPHDVALELPPEFVQEINDVLQKHGVDGSLHSMSIKLRPSGAEIASSNLLPIPDEFRSRLMGGEDAWLCCQIRPATTSSEDTAEGTSAIHTGIDPSRFGWITCWWCWPQ